MNNIILIFFYKTLLLHSANLIFLSNFEKIKEEISGELIEDIIQPLLNCLAVLISFLINFKKQN